MLSVLISASCPVVGPLGSVEGTESVDRADRRAISWPYEWNNRKVSNSNTVIGQRQLGPDSEPRRPEDKGPKVAAHERWWKVTRVTNDWSNRRWSEIGGLWSVMRAVTGLATDGLWNEFVRVPKVGNGWRPSGFRSFHAHSVGEYLAPLLHCLHSQAERKRFRGASNLIPLHSNHVPFIAHTLSLPRPSMVGCPWRAMVPRTRSIKADGLRVVAALPHDNMTDDSKDRLDHIEFAKNDEGDLSYAVDPREGPVTVLDTMGQDPDTPQTIPFKAYIVILLMGIGLFNNTFFGVAPAASAYTIAAALDGNDKRMWIVQAQGIPSIASGPIVSIIADVYGRKATIILLALLAAIASIICMTTNSMDVLLLGQVMNGIAGGISGLLYAIPSEVVPSRYRSIVQGFLSIISGGGAYAALLGMGAATSADTVNGWRWVWRTQLVCNGVLILGFAIFYNPPPRTKSDLTFWGRVKSLDWIGYFLLTGGLIPILMGFAWAADANYGWSDPHAYACVVAGTISFVLCLLYEWKGTSTGFLHHALFQNRNFPLLMFTMAVEGHMFYAVNNMYSGEVYGLWFTDVSAMKQSAALLPFFASVMVVTPLVAFCEWRGFPYHC